MIFNVGAGGATDADKIKYGDSNVGATLDNLNNSVDELDKSVDELNESLQNENNESFNFGYKDGVRGFFTNPSRADDSFIPFIKLSGTPLYHYGTDFENITGGWNDDFVIANQPNKTPHEKTDRYIYLKSTGQGNQSNCTTIKKIDLTNYNSLHYTIVGVGGNLSAHLSKEKNLNGSDMIIVKSGMSGNYVDETFDLSNISGEYYLTFAVSNGSTRNAKIYDVWLE